MKLDSNNREYAKALYRALADDAFYIAMEASVDRRITSPEEGMIRYMVYSMMEALQYGELFLADDAPYGASIWSKPQDRKTRVRQSKEKKAFIRRHMGEQSLETYTTIVDFMSSAAEPVIEDTYWYLSIVGIHPDLQGRGLGASLIIPALAKADALNIPTFLETFSPRNIPFYQRLGYRPGPSVMEPVTQTEYRIMIREPNLKMG